MIRWATDADRPEILNVMQEAKTGCAWMTYGDMDGLTLVDESHGLLRGYVRFTPGRPETWIRQLVVHPDHQGNGTTVKRLLLAVVDVAKTYGSQVIEGFVHEDHPVVRSMLARVGAQEDAGVRVRVPILHAGRFR